MLIETNWHRLV